VTRVRAAWAAIALAIARLRDAPARALLAALGIAIGVGLLGTAAGGGALAGERAATDLLDGLDPTAGRVAVSWSGAVTDPVQGAAERELRAMTPAPQTSAVVLHPVRLGAQRTLVQPAGLSPAGRWLRLRSGRLPGACTPARCEVVQVGGTPVAAAVRDAGVNLVVVGRGTLSSAAALGFLPRAHAPDQPDSQTQPPLLVSGDPDGLDDLPGLAAAYRSHTWSAPLSAAGVPSWRLDAVARRVERGRARLAAIDRGLTVDAPLRSLDAAAQRADTARSRVLLVAAGAATLLVAFAIVAAGALGGDLSAERARLDRRGAARWQLTLLSLTEAAGPAAAGVLAGGLAAVAITAIRSAGTDVDVGELLRHTFLSGGAIAAALVCWAVATALLFAAGRAGEAGGGRVGDLLAVAAAGALALGLARGGVDAAAAADGSDPLPVLLPALACLAAGIVVARLAPPLLRGAAHLTRRASPLVRTTALGLARAPRQPAVVAAFLAVAGGLSLFALSYAATLRDGQRDEADFRVPLDVTVSPGADFVRPLALASPDRWRALAGDGGAVLPVVRAGASLARGDEQVALPLIALPAADLHRLRGFDRTGASAPATRLSQALAPPGTTAGLRGAALPADATTLAVAARASGAALDLSAQVRTRDGAFVALALGATGPRPRTLRATIPPAARGGTLVAVEAAPRSGLLATQGHGLAEGDGSAAVITGTLTLGPLRAGDHVLATTGWGGRGAFGAPVATAAGGLRTTYRFDGGGTTLLGPRQPADATPVPVLTDPGTAAAARRAGGLALSVDGVPVRATVAGTLQRFPTVERDAAGFVVADTQRLSAALDAARPGAGAPNELWIAAPDPQRLRVALERPPLAGLQVADRRSDEAQLRDDPLAVELLRLLGVSAALAAALALVGLLLSTWVALRDDGAELYDLESQGVPPRTLARTLLLRAAVVAALGAIAGVALGAGLGVVVTDAIEATAASAPPQPPLVPALPWSVWLAGLIAFALIAGLATRLLVGRAFGGPVPRRPRSGGA
jgi:hypothetical protein